MALFLGWMLIWCLVDRLGHFPQMVRMGALVVGCAMALVVVVPRLLALWRPADLLLAAAAIEESNPRFRQRLVTVASRVLGASDYRGSDEILSRLMREVALEVSADRPARLVSWRPVLAPWAVVLLLALFGWGLSTIAVLHFKELAIRFLQPLADVPPVTTTQLDVAPGNRDLVQSQPLLIAVDATRLGDSPVMLYLSEDERNWSRAVMTPAGGGKFTFAMGAVDRDLRYYVSGGDARSPEYFIRVLRRPAVAQFRIRYEYPSYTRLPPNELVNTDGRIEAPAGTKVQLTIVATEPLQAALLTVGNDRLLMEHAGDANSRRAELTVGSDAKYTLDLISTREVAGSGPAGTAIHALPDLAPQVRLARAGDALRLNPRDIVPVWYEALDDYGLTSLSFRAQVNSQDPVETPVKIWGDPRRQQDVFNFDLATLPLGMGDVVSLTMIGSDTAGHSTPSAALQIVISPRSIDLDAYERMSELHDAAQLGRLLASQFDDAAKAQAEVDAQKDHQSPAYLSANSRADRALSAAAQTATLLRQALLRATTHSHSPPLSVTLAEWIDLAEIESAAAEEAFRQSGSALTPTASHRERFHDAVERGRLALSQLTTIEQGEQAAAVLADHENLRATQQRPIPKDEAGRRRLRETIERMRQDIAAEAGRIGLEPASPDLENQLRSRIHAAEDILQAARPVDFVAAARDWAQQLRQDPQQRQGLEGRLSAAAQAEAIRPDADLIRARDLELASRAAASIASTFRSGAKTVPTGALDRFIADLDALRRARELERDRKSHGASELQLARETAIKAQQDLSRSAADPLAPIGPTTRGASMAVEDRQKEAEMLAMQASAAAANHQYAQAADIDASMIQRLQMPARHEGALPATEIEPTSPGNRLEHHQQAVQREMTTARQLDDLGAQQQKLSQPPATTPSADLAGRQQNVADQIAQVAQQREETSPLPVSSGNGRDKAASQVLAAQEQLSAMPQALAAAETVAAAHREAAMRAGMALSAAQNAPPNERDAARRAADEAAQSAREAMDRLMQSLEPISPNAARSTAERLEPFAPETDAARAAILGQLAPALASLEQALKSEDAGSVERSATDARRAIESSLRELSDAQESLMRRDPLTAAKWFARAAADSLSQQPPDVGRARTHQASASVALSRAWDQSIHRAAAERLSAVPSLAAVLDLPAPAMNGPAPQQASKFAAAREWGRLRPQDASDVNASMHDADPSGYEESLKLYFEALGKAQDAGPAR
jgi:hypothetical protein